MNTSTDESPANNSPEPTKPNDISFAVVACLFIFMGIDSLIDHEWIASAGWLVTSLGLFVLVTSKPMTNENWNQPRHLLCLALFAVGISLVLCAPRHRAEPSRTLLHPPASPAPATTNL